MHSIHSLLSTALILTLLSSPLQAQHAVQNKHKGETQVDHNAFQKLLNEVDPASLHAALHDFSPKKFKHGMFPEDRTAIEVIHKEEPSLATGILNMANLAKRQNQEISNGTVSSAAPNAQTTSGRPTPVPDQSQTTITLADESKTATAGSTSSGEVLTTTDSLGHTIMTTVGGGAVTINPSIVTSTPTSTVHASSHVSTFVRTSTLPNGSQSTITAITVVAANQAADTPTGDAGVTSTSTNTGSPGLQTGEASQRGLGKELVLVLGGAVVMAVL